MVKKKCHEFVEKAPSALIDIYRCEGSTHYIHIQGIRQILIIADYGINEVAISINKAARRNRGNQKVFFSFVSPKFFPPCILSI
jgi:hypothetical protein